MKNKGHFGEKLRSSQKLQGLDIFPRNGALWVAENHTRARYSYIFASCAFSGYLGPSGHSNAHLSHILGLF